MIVRRTFISIAILVLSAVAVFGAHQILAPREPGLATLMPEGALFYLESPDFRALLSDWNSSPQKLAWLKSDNYAVFSQSRLFGRLSQAQSEFAAAAGLPPDMQLVAQIAGKQSAFAWYDIGKLEFLYITRLPSASFSQSTLWQSRSKFETRQEGKAFFYVRTDPESQRTVAFASVDDWVVLGTREDLVANALDSISGKNTRTLRDECWYADSVAAAKSSGDLRMALNLEKLVPSPYFRSYWIQQNITEMKQYRAAISDLYRSQPAYREERVLLRKTPVGTAGTRDISQLAAAVPANIGFYKAIVAPAPQQTIEILKDKLFDPRPRSEANYRYVSPAPAMDQGVGQASDLETRIDQAPPQPKEVDTWQPFLSIITTAHVNGLLLCQSSDQQSGEVFLRFPSAVVLSADDGWNMEQLKSTLAAALDTELSTARLGLGWIDRDGLSEFDGLLHLSLQVQGKYLLLSNDPALLRSVQAHLSTNAAAHETVVYASRFNHAQESGNFLRISSFIDRAGMRGASSEPADANQPRQPAFFSGNAASFSQVLSGVASESIIVHDSGQNVTQSVTYQWQ